MTVTTLASGRPILNLHGTAFARVEVLRGGFRAYHCGSDGGRRTKYGPTSLCLRCYVEPWKWLNLIGGPR